MKDISSGPKYPRNNLPDVGSEVADKFFHHFKSTTENISAENSIGLFKNQTVFCSKNFYSFFYRIGKIDNQLKVTRFHEALKAMQLKQNINIKVESCEEDRFSGSFVITCKKNISIKLALENFKNKY